MKVLSRDQSAACIIESIEAPLNNAQEGPTDLVECAVTFLVLSS